MGGNISKFHRGRLEKIVKRERERAGHVLGKPMDSLKTTSKETVQKTNGNIK